jgi:hypothetical protein
MKLTETLSKTEILGNLLPVAALRPLTEEALFSIPQIYLHSGLVPIYKAPFRIGREARIYKDEETGTLHRIERHRPNSQSPTNDLYLIDRGQKLNISREHLQIIKVGNDFTVVDRLSACGFLVNNTHHGGNDNGGRAAIQDGDTLVLGIDNSPYQFQFLDFSRYQVTPRD